MAENVFCNLKSFSPFRPIFLASGREPGKSGEMEKLISMFFPFRTSAPQISMFVHSIFWLPGPLPFPCRVSPDRSGNPRTLFNILQRLLNPRSSTLKPPQDPQFQTRPKTSKSEILSTDLSLHHKSILPHVVKHQKSDFVLQSEDPQGRVANAATRMYAHVLNGGWGRKRFPKHILETRLGGMDF